MRRAMIGLWRRSFVRALQRAGAPEITEALLTARAARLARHIRFRGEDAQADFGRALATGLHAAAELLEEAGMSRRAARDLAGAAFLANGRALHRVMLRAWLWAVPDPVGFAQSGDRLAKKARLAWGDGMQLHQENGPDFATLMVTDCPFADYFWDAGRSDLTPVLCAWDAAWMAEVNASARPVEVRRSGTIAQGCEACDFCFRRVEKRAADFAGPSAAAR